ncbi:MAG: ABC transporter permease [Acidobacteria bacterium]|nr:ABC transporter permease [Acidobacteriota bacterium]
MTLALGIGANTAIFSVVHSVLLKPLPYKDSGRLVRLMMNMPAADSATRAPLRTAVGLSAADVVELQSRTRTLSHVGTAGGVLMGLSGVEEAARLQGTRVSSSIFQMLGARALLGRVFEARDEAPGSDATILLSHSAWQRYFHGDPNIVGRTLTLDHVLGPRRQSHVAVVGVMPAGFEFPNQQTQFWMPLQETVSGGAAMRGPMLGRLADGVSIQAAAAEVGPIVRAIRRHAPRITYELVQEQDELVAPVKPALLVLTVAVGFVLLIACVNVANLMLARTATRQREIAIRVALGAGRGRVIRQLLTESVMLALLGGIGGIALALGGVRLLQRLGTTLSRVDLGNSLAFPRLDEISVDTSVLAFTAATSVITGILFGSAPALRHTRAHPIATLKEAAGSTTSAFSLQHRFGVRNLLVIAEIAMAMVLLVGGGLLMTSFVKLSSVDPGYNPTNVLTFQVSLPVDRYPDARLRTFAEDLVARLGSVPGVRAAAYANQLPMVALRDTAGGLWKTPDPTRKPAPDGSDARFVSREYFAVMGIRVIAGRGFGENDGAGQPRVMLVNQSLAATSPARIPSDDRSTSAAIPLHGRSWASSTTFDNSGSTGSQSRSSSRTSANGQGLGCLSFRRGRTMRSARTATPEPSSPTCAPSFAGSMAGRRSSTSRRWSSWWRTASRARACTRHSSAFSPASPRRWPPSASSGSSPTRWRSGRKRSGSE